MIRTVLTNVLLVGLEWKGLRCHRRASPSTVKNIKIENPEKYKEKTNSIVRKKIQRRNTRKVKVNIMRIIQSIEQKTEKQ